MSSRHSLHRVSTPAFYCNCCLTELKLFENALGSSGRVQKRYWTNCKHVLCHNCRIKNPNQCAACKQNCQFMEITRKMQKLYQLYFEPLSKIQNHMFSVLEFQSIQDSMVVEQMYRNIKRLEGKCRKEYDDNKTIRAQRKQAIAENRKMRITHQKIKEEVLRRRMIKAQVRGQHRSRRDGIDRRAENQHFQQQQHQQQQQQFDWPERRPSVDRVRTKDRRNSKDHRERRNSNDRRERRNSKHHRRTHNERRNSKDHRDRRNSKDTNRPRRNSKDHRNRTPNYGNGQAPPSNWPNYHLNNDWHRDGDYRHNEQYQSRPQGNRPQFNRPPPNHEVRQQNQYHNVLNPQNHPNYCHRDSPGHNDSPFQGSIDDSPGSFSFDPSDPFRSLL